ncbi:EamA family transporter RarD [Alkalicaulis satelles]|uniref:EamA family transporter RarD n=1 Tax=Alkalicaulis satelles TaxID=2609175 RepID=A0A5M6ZFE5_9PROT|nr:EamA family transporter RarD [Alkalicaulis satelles]KAA5803473.1 EamA family transporter RarD [Alkalicaulis satelles]
MARSRSAPETPPPPPEPSGRMEPLRAGMTALAGYAVWGLSPIFYKLLAFASAAEIVLHRAVWSVPALLILLWMARRIGPALAVLKDRRALMLLGFTALVIGSNWWLFIFAVNDGRVLEVSLGYFINPLMNVAVGVFIAHERFGRWRAVAVGLAALGVANQIITVGELPLIALVLAGTFTVYGYVRKTIAVDGRIGLFWETALLAIPSAFALIWLEAGGGSGHFFTGPQAALLLILTGPMTVAPLLLFILGARGVSFATLGLLQFLAPTLQFIVALAYGETFTLGHLVTFALIWSGLAVFALDLLHSSRKTPPG